MLLLKVSVVSDKMSNVETSLFLDNRNTHKKQQKSQHQQHQQQQNYKKTRKNTQIKHLFQLYFYTK